MLRPVAGLACAALALACLVPLASAQDAGPKPLPPEKQIFVFNVNAEPETLDPAIMTGVPEHTLATALFEGLTTHHPENLEPLPGAAESWEISPDRLTYTFHLRKDGRWSNGDPVTAEDFVWSWRRAVDPATASQYAYMLYPIKNAEAVNKKKVDSTAELGVRAADPHTLVVTLERACAYFLDLACFETLMPVHRATVEKHKDKWITAENIVSNGPFNLEEWKPRERLVLVPNPRWWNAPSVRLQRIVALTIDDNDVAYNKYLNSEVDWIRAVPLPRIDEIKKNPDFFAYPYLGSYFYRVNVTKPPFEDVRVRKAFNLAIDKVAICRDVIKSGEIPSGGHVPPGIPGWKGIQGLPFDRKEAQRILAEAGYPDGKGFPKVDLLYNTSESHKVIAEVIVQMWKENLGVTVGLYNTEWKVYLDNVDHLNYQVARAGWIGDYTDPNTFLDMFVTGGGNNNTGWSNARYDELIALAAREADPAKRMDHFREAEKILCADELPIIPIYFYVNKGAIRPRVQGWYPNIRDHHPFQYVWLSEE